MGIYINVGKEILFDDGVNGSRHIADAASSEAAHFLTTMANAPKGEDGGPVVSDNFDFAKEALVTLSPQWRGELVPMYQFMLALGNSIKVLQHLDKVKKALFYGKNPGFAWVVDEPGCENIAEDLAIAIASKSESNIVDVKKCEMFIHGAIGYATEAGEMLEALKKALDTGKVDAINVMEESGDGKWYLAVLAHVFGYEYGDDERRVIAKLRARFPDKFTAYDANNRDLAAERAILEGDAANQLDLPIGRTVDSAAVYEAQISAHNLTNKEA